MKKFIYPLITVAGLSLVVSSITIAQQRKPQPKNYLEFVTSPDTTNLY